MLVYNKYDHVLCLTHNIMPSSRITADWHFRSDI